jgi:LmbE family N-acetylglucosaminyl deacetylase
MRAMGREDLSITRARMLERLCSSDGGKGPSTVIIVAHPDDETIGASSIISQLNQVTIIHVTDGAPCNMHDARAAGFATRREYANARREECLSAMALAGVMKQNVIELGISDQEASLEVDGIANRLAEVLRYLEPDVVLTHAYEGGHPDHDATAFAVHSAHWLLEREGLTPPAMFELALYHARGGVTVMLDFLPGSPGNEKKTLVLSDDARELKRRMIARFFTQRETLKQFPIEVERFRFAPSYDFTKPPHPGRLHYEYFEWGMTGTKWRELASETLGNLRASGDT